MYLWSNGSTDQTSTFSQNGTVGVTVTDVNGCTNEASVNVIENPNPDPTIAGSTTFCTGTSTTLDAGNWNTYLWSDNSIGQTLSVSTPGTYTVTVTDGIGCIGTTEVTIDVSASLDPTIVGNPEFCEGASTTLDAGAGFTTYLWSNNENTQTINPSQSGTFTVTVSDASGCTGTEEVNVTSSPNPDPTISGQLSFCSGNTTIIDAGIWDTYLWSDNSINQTLSVSTPGTYSVTVTNASGCIGTCLLYTSPSPRDATLSRMPSSA